MTTDAAPAPPLNEPVLRWSARAHRRSPEIETELARIWANQDLTTEMDGEPGRRHVAARIERDEPRRRGPPPGDRRAAARRRSRP